MSFTVWYMPPLITPRDRFIAMNPAEKIQEIDRWLSDPEWCKDKPLRVQVTHVRNSLLKKVLRYDTPAPFTLWQLNVLGIFPANDPWHRIMPASPEWPKIGPNHIQAYWDWFESHHKI